MKKLQAAIFILCLIVGMSACTNEKSEKKPNPTPPKTETPKPKPTINVPDFNADNAYNYIQKQVDFGTRVPGTPTHKACADWLEEEMKKWADKTYRQNDKVMMFGKKVPMYNIIGAFNPDAKDRILLCAHWDTRKIADQDDERTNEPIMGANDGGSGVGVLLEMARIFKENPLKNVGVDIVLFDVEDNGETSGEGWCMGSQYWSRTPHIEGYTADFGILLDMVGAKGATFCQEGHSLFYAQNIVNKVWTTANQIGYSSYFRVNQVNPITDDHLYINGIAKIPTIDIIQYDQNIHAKGFGDFWHTHDDNMDIIDKNTLKAVGQTVLTVVYQEDN